MIPQFNLQRDQFAALNPKPKSPKFPACFQVHVLCRLDWILIRAHTRNIGALNNYVCDVGRGSLL